VRRFALVAGVLASVAARADYMDHFVIREDVGIHKAPYLGKVEILVMPVEVAGYEHLDLDAVRSFFANDFPNYYRTVSLGRYQPHVTVGPLVHYDMCPLPFANCSVARGDITAFTSGMDMMRDVVARTRDAGFDFSPLDVNGRNGTSDGWIDGTMLLTNIDFGGIAFPFGYFNTGDNLSGGMGGPLIVDGIKIGHIAIGGNSSTLVLVHEFAHVLGLTDLYAENQTYAGLQFAVMGAWVYDSNIPLHDAESRFRLRWDNWHQVHGVQHVVINPAETSGEVWRLGTGSEYFLVESRGPEGQYDHSFTARGLAVYHVDRTVKLSGVEGKFQDRLLDCVNCDAWHPYIMNVQADGRFDLQNALPLNCADDLFRDGDSLVQDDAGVAIGPMHQVPSTNFYDGGMSGIEIRDIVALDGGAFAVTLVAPEIDPCAESLCPSGDGCQPVECTMPLPAPKGCGCGAIGLSPVLAALLLLEQRLRRRHQRVF
jgi:M6 family metalloprotease-like protein